MRRKNKTSVPRESNSLSRAENQQTQPDDTYHKLEHTVFVSLLILVIAHDNQEQDFSGEVKSYSRSYCLIQLFI